MMIENVPEFAQDTVKIIQMRVKMRVVDLLEMLITMIRKAENYEPVKKTDYLTKFTFLGNW